MVGRANRPMQDDEGRCVIMCQGSKKVARLLLFICSIVGECYTWRNTSNISLSFRFRTFSKSSCMSHCLWSHIWTTASMTTSMLRLSPKLWRTSRMLSTTWHGHSFIVVWLKTPTTTTCKVSLRWWMGSNCVYWGCEVRNSFCALNFQECPIVTCQTTCLSWWKQRYMTWNNPSASA